MADHSLLRTTQTGPAGALAGAEPQPRWPGFSVHNLGPWSFQLRCDGCAQSTSPASLNETLIAELVAAHRCGPPLSTHWGESVSLAAGYALALESYAMMVEQMPWGLGSDPDVDAACARLAEAAISHREAAATAVDQFREHEKRSLYALLGRPVGPRTYVAPVVVGRAEQAVVEEGEADVLGDEPAQSPVPRRCACGHGADLHDESGCAALVDAIAGTHRDIEHCMCLSWRTATEAEIGAAVYVTVGELVAGAGLPGRPGSGEGAVGVVFAPGALCLDHLADQLNDGRLAAQLGLAEAGVVLYPGDTGPACGECYSAGAVEGEVTS